MEDQQEDKETAIPVVNEPLLATNDVEDGYDLSTSLSTDDGPGITLMVEEESLTSLQTEETSNLPTGEDGPKDSIDLPGTTATEPKERGRGRPRKSDTPKKLDEVQLSELETKADFMLVTPSLKRRRGRPPNPFKPPKPDIPRPRGRPRIHPVKMPSSRGPGRPRIHPPKQIQRFARPMNMTKTLQIRLVKCTVRDAKRRGRPPGAKNKKKTLKTGIDGEVIKKPRGRPPKTEKSMSAESMSYQDFVRQVNEELMAINGTCGDNQSDDVIGDEDTTEMDTTGSSDYEEHADYEETTDYEETENIPIEKLKRKPGRPPGAKNKIKKNLDESSCDSADESRSDFTSPKRKRGRPFGSKDSVPRKPRISPFKHTSEMSIINKVRRKPGRPPGSLNKKVGFHRRPGRPKKHLTGSLKFKQMQGWPKKKGNESLETEKRRPGRPKKERRGPGRPPKSFNSPAKVPTSVKKSGSPKISDQSDNNGMSSLDDSRLSRHCKGDVSYTEAVDDVIEIISDSESEGEVPVVKRKPGRPPKVKTEVTSEIKKRKIENSDVDSPRKRGRPKKETGISRDRRCKSNVDYVAMAEGSDIEISSDEEELSTVGSTDADSSSQKRPVGRPKKAKSDSKQLYRAEKSETATLNVKNNSISATKRPRGRPKRSIISDSSQTESLSGEENQFVKALEKTETEFVEESVQNSSDGSGKDNIDDNQKDDGIKIEEKPASDYEKSNKSSDELSDKEKTVCIKRGPGRPKKSEKRGRGRPKSYSSSSEFKEDDNSSQDDSLIDGEQSETLKRKPGRPKKTLNNLNISKESHLEKNQSKSEEIQLKTEKRGPGRPKKVHPTLEMTVTCVVDDSYDNTGISSITMEGWEGFSSNVVKRPRGRPKKIENSLTRDRSRSGGLVNGKDLNIRKPALFSMEGSKNKPEPKVVSSNTNIQTDDNLTNGGDTPINIYLDDVSVTKTSVTQQIPHENSIQKDAPNPAVSNPSVVLGLELTSPSKLDMSNHNVIVLESDDGLSSTQNNITSDIVNSLQNKVTEPAVILSSENMVTDQEASQTKVVAEPIPQNSGPVSSLYYDVSIS